MNKPYSHLKPALFFLLSVIFNLSVAAQTSVPFELTNEGHIIVKGKINGVEGNFIFDTGAGMTVISKKYALKINGLTKQEAGFTGLRETGEKLTIDLYQGKLLTLDSFIEDKPVMGVLDVDFGPYDGLISLKSFKNQPFTIDYEHKEITFETFSSLAHIEKKGRIIPIQMDIFRDKTVDVFAYFKVNDKLTLQLLIDGGAGKDVYFINTNYLEALGVDTLNAKKRYKQSEFNHNEKVTVYMAAIQSITAKSQPEIKVQNVKASFIPGLIYDGKVSLNWIGKQITFDLKKEEMIVF